MRDEVPASPLRASALPVDDAAVAVALGEEDDSLHRPKSSTPGPDL